MRPSRAVGAALALAALAGGCASAPVAPQASPPPAQASRNLAANADFEADPSPGRDCPPSWWCTMHADTGSFRFSLARDAGANGRFLQVTRVRAEPWALVTQVFLAAGLEGRRVRVSASVNTERLDEGAGAGPMVMLQAPGGRVLGHRQVTLARGQGWRREVAEIEIVPGTHQVEIALLVEGGGTAGFDDVEATILAPVPK